MELRKTEYPSLQVTAISRKHFCSLYIKKEKAHIYIMAQLSLDV